MKKSAITLSILLISGVLMAQVADTTVFTVVDEMPRFPGCEVLYDSLSQRNDCAQKRLLEFIYQHIGYPEEARVNNIEGTVVVRFVVEKDGSVSTPSVVRDIGGGCGAAAVQAVDAMNIRGVQWIPGKKEGKAVRVAFTLPVKFKLEEPKDYVMMGRDSVFTRFDKQPVFKGGTEALKTYLDEHLHYPAAGQDSCYVGHMDLTLLVRPNGETYVLEVHNYNDLGFDYLWEAIWTTHAMRHQWEPATLDNRPVTTATELRLSFLPKNPACVQRLKDFENAEKWAEEGSALFNEGKQEEGLAKLTQAVNLFPENAQYRYIRGQAYVQMKKMPEACADYSYVRMVLNIPEVDQLTKIICAVK